MTTPRNRWTSAAEDWVRDGRYALRLLRKTPGFTFTALLTLALAIGVNTAVFSVVDAVLLAPLPYPQPEQLALVSRTVLQKGVRVSDESVNGRTWELVRDSNARFKSAVFSTWTTGVNFTAAAGPGRPAPSFVRLQRVGAGFFDVLGIPPAYGREFNADEDRPTGSRAVVLSAALWRTAFNGDPAAVGRSIVLRGEPHTIVGVMPEGFATGEPADLWAPLRPSTTAEGGGENYHVLVRFNADSEAAAREEVTRIGEQLDRERSRDAGDDAKLSFSLVPLQRGLTRTLRQPLSIISWAVAIVLVAACVNLAGLMIARASGRAREIATRLALGSGRAAMLRQVFVEALLLGAIGGVAGIGVASLTLEAFGWLTRDAFEIWQPVSLDGRSIAATASIAMAASVAIGLGAAIHAVRQPAASLTVGASRSIAGASNRWPRRLLVVAQVALGALLLAGSGLLVRTFHHLQRLDPGFDPAGVRAASISLDDVRYSTAGNVRRLLDESIARMKAVPGVESAAATLGLPYERLLNLGFRYAGPVRAGDAQTGMTSATYVTPEFFTTMRIPIRRGRQFDDRDRAGASEVAIVNEAFARAYFRERDPIGQRIRITGVEREIVGVAGDVQLKPGWGDFGPLAAMPLTYVPVGQIGDGFARLVHAWFRPTFVVRASDAAGSDFIRAAVQHVDPMLPLASIRSMSEVRAAALAQQRLLMVLLLGLAAAAVLVSAIGVHGLISATVTERTREMGIRLALGATAGRALGALAMPGVSLAAAGTAIGLVCALGAVRFIRHFVWGIGATDPLTFAAVSGVMLTASAVASFAPALRILRLDPAITLRDE